MVIHNNISAKQKLEDWKILANTTPSLFQKTSPVRDTIYLEKNSVTTKRPCQFFARFIRGMSGLDSGMTRCQSCCLDEKNARLVSSAIGGLYYTEILNIPPFITSL